MSVQLMLTRLVLAECDDLTDDDAYAAALDRLEAKGLIRQLRDPFDPGGSLLSLTDEGRRWLST